MAQAIVFSGLCELNFFLVPNRTKASDVHNPSREAPMKVNKEKCAHPACTCNKAEGSKYCSAYCEAAADTTELMCGCGHAGCGTDAIQEPEATMTA